MISVSITEPAKKEAKCTCGIGKESKKVEETEGYWFAQDAEVPTKESNDVTKNNSLQHVDDKDVGNIRARFDGELRDRAQGFLGYKPYELVAGEEYKLRNGEIGVYIGPTPNMEGIGVFWYKRSMVYVDYPTDKIVRHIPKKQTITGCLNVYRDAYDYRVGYISGVFYESKSHADANSNDKRIACVAVTIEFTEEEGL